MPHVDVVGPGSGEGVGHLFQAWSNAEKRLIPIRQAAILSAAEVSTLNAMKARRASTLFPELNKAWMGEPLGFAYVTKEKSLKIEEGLEGRTSNPMAGGASPTTVGNPATASPHRSATPSSPSFS